MRAIAVFVFSVFPMLAADLKIDHATVAGANLEQMRRAFAAATGIQAEYGGPHSNHATEMALASFPDGSYLELMGIQSKPDPAAVSAHEWSKFLQSNAGPCAFAVRVSDLNAELQHLKSAGIHVESPEAGGRTRPDGQRLDWQTVAVGPGQRGSLLPFLIQDRTPHEDRVYPSGKPSTDHFRGIAKVVIGVSDLDSAIAQYRRAFGLPAPQLQRDREFDAELAGFEGTPIILAKGLTGNSWLSKRVREYGDAPCAFILATTSGSGNHVSVWFGHPILWEDSAKLGWRLGVEAR